MKSSSKNKGAASVLVIVGIIIVAWTIGMLIPQGNSKKKNDAKAQQESSGPSKAPNGQKQSPIESAAK
jgi:hypothetical protein